MIETLLNNRYRILQALSKGGFSQTYLAIDTYLPSERKCVIKQLQTVQQAPEHQKLVQERFQREAAILEALGAGSEQIPQLYAYFSEGDHFYLVQEWVEGVTLAQKVQQQGKLPENTVQEIIVSLLVVLDYVHSRHMIHRDIKPDNIILRGSDGQPVLIDFGAVKEAVNTRIADGNFTNSIAIGTPGFMASEQAAGRPLYSSDLYSLGLTAIFLLTGKIPQQLSVDPNSGEFLWRQQAPDLHSRLATVIDRTIRYHPRDRFSSAAEMLAALEPDMMATGNTIAVSPGASPRRKNPSSASTLHTVAVTPPAIAKNNQPLRWVLGSTLLVSAIAASAVAFYFLTLNDRKSLFPIISQPTPIPESSPFPLPSPSPEVVVSPTPEPTPEATSEPVPQPTPETPVVTPTPLPTPSPSPIPIPSAIPNTAAALNLPIFPLGTEKKTVVNALGEPTSIRSGLQKNTEVLNYYDYIPGKANVGYLFHTGSGRLRQMEVSFAPSVALDSMQQALDNLVGGNAPAIAQEGLESIYQGQSNFQAFSVGEQEGIIQRNPGDRIYIGIWDRNLTEDR